MALKNNTWKLNQWYDQNVAGNVSYTGSAGPIWAWGGNNNGNLGQNSTAVNAYSSPIQIFTDTTWDFFKSGSSHTAGDALATKTDGTLWSWGYNYYGQLGLNNRTKYSSPVQIPGTNWSAAIMGRSVPFAVKTDGTMYAMGGRNSNGTSGIPSLANDQNFSSPVQVPGTTWTGDIYHSNDNVIAKKSDGTVWTWGQNAYGNLGQNNRTKYSSPVQIPGTNWSHFASGDEQYVLATKTDGTLWSWGSAYFGGLGINTSDMRSSPTQIGTDTTWATGEGKIAQGGPGLAVAIKTDGTLWSWGYNNDGALGQNSRTQYSSPVQVGSDTNWNTVSSSYGRFVLATKTDGTLWNWGSNDSTIGASYFPPSNAQPSKYSSPVQVPGSWKSVLATRRNVFLQELL